MKIEKYRHLFIFLNPLSRTIFSILILCFIAANAFGSGISFFVPAGYDYMHMERQSVHSFAAGAGFMSGEHDIAFNEVEHRFFGLALYQPFFFRDEPQAGVSKQFHQISAILDGRIERHQLLAIFSSAADKPVSGLSTFQAGFGWGYEVIRRQNTSLILGGALGVSDFGITLPSGASLPVLPLPLIRFGIDTQWFVSSLDFLAGLYFSSTIAPKEKIRLTADMNMENFRNIDDLTYKYTLWYRLFSTDHKLGDFAGIGAGIKHDMKSFVLSRDATYFELQHTSVFAVIDISVLKIQGGWIFNSNYLIDEEKHGSPGKGFYVSVQGMIPINFKK